MAAFDLAAKAHMAKNALESAGISAVVTDQEIVAMDWLLSNSVGGIKVQVWEADGERAAAVLDEAFGPQSGLASEDLDEDELTRQALIAEPTEDVEESGHDPAPVAVPIAAEEPETALADRVEREEYARRFLLAAVGGLIFLPLLFYAIYLFLNAAFGPGPLSARGWRRLAIGAVIVPVWLLVWAATWQLGLFPTDFLPGVW